MTQTEVGNLKRWLGFVESDLEGDRLVELATELRKAGLANGLAEEVIAEARRRQSVKSKIDDQLKREWDHCQQVADQIRSQIVALAIDPGMPTEPIGANPRSRVEVL